MTNSRWIQRGWTLLLLAAVFLILTNSSLAADAGDSGDEGGPFQWFPFLAPFHSVVLHLPIGFVLLACVFEVCAMRRPNSEVRGMIGLTHFLCIFASIATIALGLMRAMDGGYEEKALDSHKWWGVAVGFLTIGTLILHHAAFKGDNEKKPLAAAYRVVLAVNFGILSIAGHLGGNLTHGSEYLVANAPQFVKEILDHDDDDDPMEPDAGVEDGGAAASGALAHFNGKVWPALEAKCIRCHGKEKKKGGYTLVDKGIAFKGGDSELEAIVPGNPAKSYLVETILLPEDDEYAMPPEGKEPLTQEEALAIIQWVKDGAAWPDKLP